MRIGIDCRTILNPEKGQFGGIGHYVYQLVRHLLKIEKNDEFILFFDRKVENKRLIKFKKPNVKIKFFPFFLYGRFLSLPFVQTLISAFIEREKLDIFHAPVPNLPEGFKGRAVVTIHDLAILKVVEIAEQKEDEQLKRNIIQNLGKAEKILVPSFSTKKDLEENFKVEPKKIKVIYHGIDQRFFIPSNPKSIQTVRKRYGIIDNYIFFVGPIELRKNICRMIVVYEEFREVLKKNPVKFKSVLGQGKKLNCQLVLAGKPGNGFHKIESKIKKSKFNQDIILTGYLPAEELKYLFDGAKAFLFPSLYEGFGLPVIEAMASRLPVVTSNISALPEVAGKAALLVDPYRISSIKESLIEILSNETLRQELIQKGLKQVKKYQWRKTAELTLGVYHSFKDLK